MLSNSDRSELGKLDQGCNLYVYFFWNDSRRLRVRMCGEGHEMGRRLQWQYVSSPGVRANPLISHSDALT